MSWAVLLGAGLVREQLSLPVSARVMRGVNPGSDQWCGDGASPSLILLGGAV